MYHDLTQPENRLSGETNAKSILVLDEQIREHEVALRKLKRARNSLLNVSKLPPEVLGDIFRWNVTLKGDFGGLGRESHNFLLVCHYWLEVASSTPELWSFWGNTPKDWARWCRRSGTAPLDLVLNANTDDDNFDTTLFGILQDRANRDTIRRIHLKAVDSELLSSIISSLTAGSGVPQSSGVESFILQNESDELVDVSDFFAYNHFPKLRRLELSDCTMSSWNLITSRITTLTTLDLDLNSLEPAPSTLQLLSVLASNPTLRKVALFGYATPDEGAKSPSSRVSLHYLKELRLGGDPQTVFGILGRLDHPRLMDTLDITLYGCAVDDVSRIVGPHLRDYLQHRGRSQCGLGLSLSSGYDIRFHVGDVGGIDFSVPAPAQMNTFMMVAIKLNQTPSKGRLEKAILDLIAHAPREEIVYFRAYGKPLAAEDISAQFPNLRGLHFERTPLPAAFPKANLDGDGETFRCLQYICLDRVAVSGGDGWEPLITFLLWRVRSGSRLHSLAIVGPYRRPPTITQVMVQEFRLTP